MRAQRFQDDETIVFNLLMRLISPLRRSAASFAISALDVARLRHCARTPTICVTSGSSWGWPV